MNKRVVHKIFAFAISPILSTALFLLPVHAENSIFYPDPESYSAYNYFIARGYSDLILSDTNNTVYNVKLDNIGTNNGTIKGTDTTTGTDKTTGTFNSNGSSTLGAKYMTCTTNNAVSGTQTYSCRFSNTQTGSSNSQSINIGFNSNLSTSVSESTSVNETINQSINTDITGTITGSTTFNEYVKLPWLKGTYTSKTGYSNGFSLNYINREFVLAYYTNNRTGSYNVSVITTSSAKVDITKTDTMIDSNMTLHVIRVKQKDGSNIVISGYINANTGDSDVLPVYYGYENTCPDDIAIAIGLRLPVSKLMDTGNSTTSNKVNNSTQSTNTLTDKFNNFDTMENNSVTDMDTNIENLNLTTDLLDNSKFLNSAIWVKTQFDNMTVSTPIGSVIQFSLILGITLIFLGKIR